MGWMDRGFGRSTLFTILGDKLGNTVCMSLPPVIQIWKWRNLLSTVGGRTDVHSGRRMTMHSSIIPTQSRQPPRLKPPSSKVWPWLPGMCEPASLATIHSYSRPICKGEEAKHENPIRIY